MKRSILCLILPALLIFALAGCRIRLLEEPEGADLLLAVSSEPQSETPPQTEQTEPEPPASTQTEHEPEYSDPSEPEPPEHTEDPAQALSPSEPAPEETEKTSPPKQNQGASSGSGGQSGGKTPSAPSAPPASETEPPTETGSTEAVWITVYFEPNGGDGPAYQARVSPGEAYGPLPEVSRRGHIFNGWWTEAEGGERILSDSTVNRREDHVLYAHWLEADSFQITFDANGGRIKAKDAHMRLRSGEAFGVLPTPIWEGYRFLGWFTAPTEGEAVTESTVFEGAADLILFAHWQYDPFAYWSFTLQNKIQQVYLCQQASVYFETPQDHVTQTQVALLSDTGCLNIAQYLTDPVTTDDWVLAKNPHAIVKAVESMSQQQAVLDAMTLRFPGKKLFLVTSAALNGSDEGLYARLFLAKALYSEFFADVDLERAARELELTEPLIAAYDLP